MKQRKNGAGVAIGLLCTAMWMFFAVVDLAEARIGWWPVQRFPGVAFVLGAPSDLQSATFPAADRAAFVSGHTRAATTAGYGYAGASAIGLW